MALVQKEFDARLELKIGDLETHRISIDEFARDIRDLMRDRSKDLEVAEQPLDER
ncbi:hypothetical protein [Pseudomonas monteilii]|uniref:hypothetical protein n=1 Tax=Pseudomonas monteilii TaxID=76759 RepID=UPI0012D82D20|nr:hypothetical protein [Pseudomonas monteilii]